MTRTGERASTSAAGQVGEQSVADMDERYRAMLLRLTPVERLTMACRMFSTAQQLVRAGIGAKGVVEEAEIRRQPFLRFCGNDIEDPELRERAADEIAARSGAPATE